MFYKVMYANEWTRENEIFLKYVSCYNTDERDAEKMLIERERKASVKMYPVRFDANERAALRAIYKHINSGYEFGTQVNNVKYPYFDAVLYRTFSGNIGWTHYGSSAESNTIADLEWLLLVIFGLMPSEFALKYAVKKVA
jgi:hypothetical protein